MSDQEIAEKMVEIVDEFQRQTGMPDEVADSVVRHCFRKIELIDAPAEYILLLLPDELKNACFRSWINKRTMELVKKKGGGCECAACVDSFHATRDVLTLRNLYRL